MAQEVLKYRKPTRILHWVHLFSFCILFLTGLILFLPPLAFLAEDSWTRIVHRIAAVVFIIAPLIYMFTGWKATWSGVKEAFTWGADDLGWLKAAPRYYFLGDDKGMPPQDAMNTGQKMWWFLVLVFGVVFVISGAIMWFAKATAPAALLQWMVFLHDVSFIVTGAMLFVHIYLGVFHPLMRPFAWNSINRGTVPVEYAKSHHGKWYARIAKGG
ncbi:formate dehydrogenase subunit gamma [Chloroflexota bacterium]